MLISYKELETIRLHDFVPADMELDVEISGMMAGVGIGGFERLDETLFVWRNGEDWLTCAVILDLRTESKLPNPVAERILQRLGLPVTKGMSSEQLIAALGPAKSDEPGGPGKHSFGFIVGEQEKYIFNSVVDETHGLIWFFFGRKDYCDEADAA